MIKKWCSPCKNPFGSCCWLALVLQNGRSSLQLEAEVELGETEVHYLEGDSLKI